MQNKHGRKGQTHDVIIHTTGKASRFLVFLSVASRERQRPEQTKTIDVANSSGR